MKINRVEPFILHVPVTRDDIADSIHAISHWGAPGVRLHTDTGLVGYGYTGTHAHLPTDRLITACIEHAYGPLLMGADPREVRALWQRLNHHPPIQWVGRAGITTLALAAIDVALWDLKAKAGGMPLWKLLGGDGGKRIEAYNTDSGWLNWPLETLVDDAKRLVQEQGYRGVKIKLGSDDPQRDLQRVEAVRHAIGPHVKLMTDANGRWDLPTAVHVGARLAAFDVRWLEEPIWYDDLAGHASLARRIDTPIALGEQLYQLDDFRNFIAAGAVDFVQADAVRLAGITEWWAVADLAFAHRLPVVPHVGDMMQIHLHTTLAHPASTMLEYIPWLRGCFVEPATVEAGYYRVPEAPGAGTTLTDDAFSRYSA